jgi:hypothetical protein
MASGKRQTGLVASLAALVAVCTGMTSFASDAAEGKSFWPVYESALKGAKYAILRIRSNQTSPSGQALPVHPRTGQGWFGHRRCQEGRRTPRKHGRGNRICAPDRSARHSSTRRIRHGISSDRRARRPTRYGRSPSYRSSIKSRPIRPTLSGSPTSRPGKKSMAAYRRGRWCSCVPTGRRHGPIPSSPP